MTLPAVPERGGPDDDLAVALDRLVGAVVRERAALAARHGGVTAIDLLALSHLRREGPLTPGALGRALLLSPSGATAVVHRLVDAGLAVRSPGSANHRDVRVTATEAGAALGAVAVPAATSDMVALVDAVAQAAERRADRLVAEQRAAAAQVTGVPEPGRWG